MSSALPLRLLLLFALLLTQFGGLVHGISHAHAAQTQDQSLPHEKHCDLCASYAQLGGALPSVELSRIVEPHDDQFTALPDYRFQSLSFAAFAARAPPGFA